MVCIQITPYTDRGGDKVRSIVLNNGFRLLKKHLFQTIIMTILALLCLYILGAAMNASDSSTEAKNKFEETYGNKTLYYTSEFLSDPVYYSYREEAGTNNYEKLKKFLISLYQAKEFLFTSVSMQDVQITSQPIPEQFLYGYENGYTLDSVVEYNGETLYTAKSLQVSSNFFDVFSVSISEGKGFTDKDYLLSENQIVPTILGSAYREFFEIGDTFEGYYMGEKLKFCITGFISDNTFFFDRSVDNMVSCERYIILPAFIMEEADDFARIILLDRTNGFVHSSIGYEKTNTFFKQYLDNARIGEWEISLMYRGNFAAENVLEKYSAMTDEVSRQFKIIVLIIVVFASLVNIVVICSMLRENFQNFGIELLCGASYKDIIIESSISVVFIMLVSDLIASMLLILFGYSVSSLFIVQIATIAIIFLSCSICGIYIKRMKLNTYIGGKE